VDAEGLEVLAPGLIKGALLERAGTGLERSLELRRRLVRRLGRRCPVRQTKMPSDFGHLTDASTSDSRSAKRPTEVAKARLLEVESREPTDHDDEDEAARVPVRAAGRSVATVRLERTAAAQARTNERERGAADDMTG
jgi:hypothetical protein